MLISELWFRWPYGLRYLSRHGIKASIRRTREILRPIVPAGTNTFSSITTELINSAGVEILVVSCDPASPSHAYRVENYVSGFTELGLEATWISYHDFLSWRFMPISVRLVIFWRTHLPAANHPILKENLRTRRFLVAYDTDDLTFDAEAYTRENVVGLRALDKKHQNQLLTETLEKQASQILDSDFTLAPTEQIRTSFLKFNKETYLVPSVLPRWMESQAKAIYSHKKVLAGTEFKIVYASGTNTHQTDFLSAWKGLVSFLEEYPNVELHIIGFAPISHKDIPRTIRDRVHTHAFVPHQNLLNELAKYDLQLAPVELGNSFVEAKSALKFIQGASIGIPTIASPSSEFRRVIKHGTNGWLAESSQDWVSSLKEAIKPDVYHAVSVSARHSFERDHTISSLLPKLSEISTKLIEPDSFPSQRRGARKVVWILPDLPAGSGGHRNVLRFAEFLPKDKFDSTVVLLSKKESQENLRAFAQTHYGMSSFQITTDLTELYSADVVFATHHSTTDIIKLFAPPTADRRYLVQDFECLFGPMSDEYLHALETYFDEEMKIICSGEWMSKKVLQITGREVPFFHFPVDKSIYNTDGADDSVREGILFFAKADTPRRLYQLGIQAIQIIHKLSPGTKIGLYGGDPNWSSPGVTNHGRLPHLTDLAELYKKYSVGLAFSPTNPSLIPYEMMACGLPVVDVEVRDDAFPKFGMPPAALLCRPNPSELAKEILELLNSPSRLRDFKDRGLQLAENMPDESDVAQTMDKFLSE